MSVRVLIFYYLWQDTVVLWSKSSTLDWEIRGSNIGGDQKPQKCFHLKMMPRILSRPELDRDGKAEEISRKNGRAEGAQVGGISSLNVNTTAEQGEMEIKINIIVFMCALL